jgi:ABC-type lipoprotein release transport system permease subunit
LTLCGPGGVIGIGPGWLGTYVVTRIYPAVRAALLDPVDALSYDQYPGPSRQ